MVRRRAAGKRSFHHGSHLALRPILWQPGGRHYGRGKYLIKAGDRTGIPVEMTLVGDEPDLYNTDPGALR